MLGSPLQRFPSHSRKERDVDVDMARIITKRGMLGGSSHSSVVRGDITRWLYFQNTWAGDAGTKPAGQLAILRDVPPSRKETDQCPAG